MTSKSIRGAAQIVASAATSCDGESQKRAVLHAFTENIERLENLGLRGALARCKYYGAMAGEGEVQIEVSDGTQTYDRAKWTDGALQLSSPALRAKHLLQEFRWYELECLAPHSRLDELLNLAERIFDSLDQKLSRPIVAHAFDSWVALPPTEPEK